MAVILIKAWAILNIGIFGAIMIGVSSLLLGSLVRLFSFSPLIYFAAMAGVMFPVMMVASGMLAMWASERPPKGQFDVWCLICRTLAAGMMTALGGTFLTVVAFALTGGSLLSDALAGLISPRPAIWLKLLTLMAAYLALSIIGGALYSIVVPDEACSR